MESALGSSKRLGLRLGCNIHREFPFWQFLGNWSLVVAVGRRAVLSNLACVVCRCREESHNLGGDVAMPIRPIARATAWLFFRGTDYYEIPMFPVVADSIAMGCVLAILREKLELQSWYLHLFHAKFALPLAVAVLLMNSCLGYTVVYVVGSSFINLILAILIHRSVYSHSDWVGRLLNLKPLVAIGTLSYSLYIWQQLFLNRKSEAWTAAFPQNLVLTVIVALASYHFLEKPFLKLRSRLRPK